MKQDRFIRLTFDDHPESITFVNLRHIKRFGANDSGGSYVHIKGDNRIFKETPEQILAQIGGEKPPYKPKSPFWMREDPGGKFSLFTAGNVFICELSEKEEADELMRHIRLLEEPRQ